MPLALGAVSNRSKLGQRSEVVFKGSPTTKNQNQPEEKDIFFITPPPYVFTSLRVGNSP